MSTVNPDQLEELLSAYLDGELDPSQTKHVERLLRESAGAQRALDELRMTSESVRALPRHAAPASILEEVRSHLERAVLLDSDSMNRPGRVAVRGRWFVRGLSMAAALAIVATGAWWYGTGRVGWMGQEQKVAVVPSDKLRRELKTTADRESGQTRPFKDSSSSANDFLEKKALPPVAAPHAGEKKEAVAAAASESVEDREGRRPESNSDSPLHVQVFVASEADQERMVHWVQTRLQNSAGGETVAVRSQEENPTRSTRFQRTDADGRRAGSAPATLRVHAPVETLNTVIKELASADLSAQNITLHASGTAVSGVRPVQNALSEIVVGQLRRSADPGERLAQVDRGESSGLGIFEGLAGIFGLDRAATPSFRGASTLQDSRRKGGAVDAKSQPDPADLRLNAAMEIRPAALDSIGPPMESTNVAMGTHTESDAIAAKTATAGEIQSESKTASSQTQESVSRRDANSAKQPIAPATSNARETSLVERSLSRAAEQSMNRNRHVNSDKSRNSDDEASRSESIRGAEPASQTLTVLFEFLVQAPVPAPVIKRPLDADSIRKTTPTPAAPQPEEKRNADENPR